MHVLQPLIKKLKPDEINKLLSKFNISLTQIPKIKITDPSLPKDIEIADVVMIERISEGKKIIYYRVVSV